MKNTFLAFALLLFISSLTSCVVLSPKKYKALLGSKDSLYTAFNEGLVKIENLDKEVSRLKKDTTMMAEELRDLQNNYNEVDANYKKLKNNSTSEITKLSGDLAAREKRLKEVEEVLRKRDEATNSLKEKLQQALLGFTKNGLTVEIKNGKVYVSLTDKLLFPSGSIIIDEKGKQALTQLANVLKQQPEINIAVEGHTDNQKINNLGQIKDNWDLSVLRATSVVRYLTENEKVESVRMTATGKGEFQPLGANNTAESRSKNRRIEIVLSPKLDELYNLIK
ncbi:chemotaxis protein MotB [Pedobacter psychrotolerans]|uniref:Chemotaxis protein MotB n=1 Tax=Pedobacter psychrotolerans TaxID=1843235 RepID=A0A4R2H9G3_9SPHI|nr:OmpA family protein [Pedobacter psychrotolerans]TCO23699.1 chemotaxis protein MotB [Pedobacter psychrotolerans]GGE61929.1 flagellar motor protein MotB [Pedobacter psychrotolerans]